MRRVILFVIVIASMVLLVAATSDKKTAATREVVWPADQIKFKEIAPGASRAVLWGDPDKGAYEAIVHFTKGFHGALHTHMHDERIVVLSGTLTYDSGSGEQKLGPGSYLMQPAKVKHVTGCTADADCMLVEQSPGKFTLDFVKERK